jgi:hypothetical protein
LRAFPKLENASLILIQKNSTCRIFASIHTSISLNQGQGSIFTLQTIIL